MIPYDIRPPRPDVFMVGSKSHQAELVRHMSSSLLLLTGSSSAADRLLSAWIRDGDMDWQGLREIYLRAAEAPVSRYAELGLDEVPVDKYLRGLFSLQHFPAIERSHAALYRAIAGPGSYREAGNLIVQEDFVLLPHRRFHRDLSYLLTEVPYPFLESMLDVSLGSFTRSAENFLKAAVDVSALREDLLRIFKENAHSDTWFGIGEVMAANRVKFSFTVFADGTCLHFMAERTKDDVWSWQLQGTVKEFVDESGEVSYKRSNPTAPVAPVSVEQISRLFNAPAIWDEILDFSPARK